MIADSRTRINGDDRGPPAPDAGQFEWSCFYRRNGLSVIPIKADGSRAPAFNGWRAFSDRLSSGREILWWFGCPRDRFAIGLPGGRAGQVVFPDFEAVEVFKQWMQLIPSSLMGKVAASPQVATPNGGRHVYARCAGDPPPGQVYARRSDGKTLVEVRGAGHQVLAPGSPARAHPTGRPYEFLRLGWLAGPPATPSEAHWTPDDLAAATDAMRALGRCPRKVIGVPRNRGPSAVTGDRPGDLFNRRADWEAIFGPHGWRPYRSSGDTTYWTRPNKTAGVSATTGHCESESAGDLFYCFTSSAPPFEPGTAYSRFAAYTLLEHGGDFTAAARARALAWAGHGRARVAVRLAGKAVR